MQPTSKRQIHIGPAGWSYPDWKGIVYPEGDTRSFDPLAFLASYFNLIEINSTFYRVPSRATCRLWVERTSHRHDFVFTVKAPRDMTHRPNPASQREVAVFKTSIEPLRDGGQLGAVLIQFPWSFRPTSEAMRYVEELAERFVPFPTVVEVRHGGWGTPRGVSFFRESGITLCGIDQPLIGDSLSPESYSPGRDRAYFRLHGRNKEKWFSAEAGRDERYNYLYDVSELSPWRQKISETAERVENVFVVLNNHFRGQAVVNALQLQAMLFGGRSRAPRSLIEKYPQAGDLLKPANERRVASGEPPRRQLELFREEHNDEQRDDDE